jgi:hypothetical protein
MYLAFSLVSESTPCSTNTKYLAIYLPRDILNLTLNRASTPVRYARAKGLKLQIGLGDRASIRWVGRNLSGPKLGLLSAYPCKGACGRLWLLTRVGESLSESLWGACAFYAETFGIPDNIPARRLRACGGRDVSGFESQVRATHPAQSWGTCLAIQTSR